MNDSTARLIFAKLREIERAIQAGDIVSRNRAQDEARTLLRAAQ